MSNNEETKGVVFKEVDVLDVIRNIGKKNKQTQAKLMQELEKYVDKNTPEFDALRKFVLDEINSYTRSVVRTVFGDIEYLIK